MGKKRREPRNRSGLGALSLSAIIVLAAFLPVLAQEEGRVEVRWTSEGPPENPFRSIGGMVGAPDGSVYIVDRQARSLYRFDPDAGEYSWFNRTGEGPGELVSPLLVALTSAGQIAVFDIRRRMVLVYSDKLEPQRQIVIGRTITNPKGFAFLSDDSFIIAGGLSSALMMGASFFGVQRFSGADGKRIGEYVRLPDPGQEHRNALRYVAGGPLWSLEEGGFLFSNSAPHRILHVDADFNETEIAADVSVVPPIVEKFLIPYLDPVRGPAIRPDWRHDQSRGVFRLSDSRILNIVTRQHSGISTWELWTMEGELLNRFDVDNAWRPFGITKDEDVLVAYYGASGEMAIAALRWK